MYNKVSAAIVLLLATIFVGACSVAPRKGVKKVAGVWAAQPITIDGSSADWHTPYPYYDEKAMLGYSICNDSENLYITMQTGDAATQIKILQNGLTLWIDKTAKQQEVTAINFPIPASYKSSARKDGAYSRQHIVQDNGPTEAIQKRLIEMQQNVKKAIEAADEYSLQGFKGCNLQFPVLAQNSCGIVVRINMDQDNELIWEAKIPFAAFYFKPKVDRADIHRQLNICFETTGAKRPDGQPAARGGTGRRSGIRPGISIGGMGMGMQFGGAGGSGSNAYDPNFTLMEPLYKSTKTWAKAGIAIK